MKILVVLSGGQDSTTCLFWAKQQLEQLQGHVPAGGHELHAITFDYGQRHRLEIEAAKIVARMADVRSHEIIEVPNCLRSTSPLVDYDNELERYDNYEQMDKVIGNRTELTFVPMRNTLFLTIAANRAVALGCRAIVTGVCEQDNANYPDCRADYISSMEHAINTSLGANDFTIHCPLIRLTKSQSVKLAKGLPGCMDALAYSHTSYDGLYPPIDMNHANVLRARGFEEANEPDPLVVRAWSEGLMDLPLTVNYNKLRTSSLALGEGNA
jgi:7-cyano-7-deazaguanine synthase